MSCVAVGAGVAAAAAGAAISGAMSGGGSSAAGAINGANQQASAQAVYAGRSLANDRLNPYYQTGMDEKAILQTDVNSGLLNNPLSQAQYQQTPGYTPMVNSLADLQATPGYQFQLEQGLQGVNNSATSKGSLLSGATLKGINDYAQGQAATGYQNAWQRAQTAYQNAFANNQSAQQQRYGQMNNFVNAGLSAANSMGSNDMNTAGAIAGINTNYATNAGNLALYNGQNNANMATGVGNALTSGLGQYLTSGNSSTPSVSNTNLGGYNSGNYNSGIESLSNPSSYNFIP